MPTNLMDSMASKMESELREIPEALNSRAKKITFLSSFGINSDFFCTVDCLFSYQFSNFSALFHLIFSQPLIPEYVIYHLDTLIILP